LLLPLSNYTHSRYDTVKKEIDEFAKNSHHVCTKQRHEKSKERTEKLETSRIAPLLIQLNTSLALNFQYSKLPDSPPPKNTALSRSGIDIDENDTTPKRRTIPTTTTTTTTTTYGVNMNTKTSLRSEGGKGIKGSKGNRDGKGVKGSKGSIGKRRFQLNDRSNDMSKDHPNTFSIPIQTLNKQRKKPSSIAIDIDPTEPVDVDRFI